MLAEAAGASNDCGVVQVKSGATARVRRSSKDLDIVCKGPANPDAVAKAISRTNGGMFGNIVPGGGIGAIIDHNNGTACSYPIWAQMVFGKSLAFDRPTEKWGVPRVGKATGRNLDGASGQRAP